MLWFWDIMCVLLLPLLFRCKIANACYCVKIPHLSAFKYNRIFNLSKRSRKSFVHHRWDRHSHAERARVNEWAIHHIGRTYISPDLFIWFVCMLWHVCNWHLVCLRSELSSVKLIDDRNTAKWHRMDGKTKSEPSPMSIAYMITVPCLRQRKRHRHKVRKLCGWLQENAIGFNEILIEVKVCGQSTKWHITSLAHLKCKYDALAASTDAAVADAAAARTLPLSHSLPLHSHE